MLAVDVKELNSLFRSKHAASPYEADCTQGFVSRQFRVNHRACLPLFACHRLLQPSFFLVNLNPAFTLLSCFRCCKENA